MSCPGYLTSWQTVLVGKIYPEVRRQVGRWETCYLFCNHLWPVIPLKGNVADQFLSEAEKDPSGSPGRSVLLPCPLGGKGSVSSSATISISASFRRHPACARQRTASIISFTPGEPMKETQLFPAFADKANTGISFSSEILPYP